MSGALLPPTVWQASQKDLAAGIAPAMWHRGDYDSTAAAIIIHQYGQGTDFPIPLDSVLLVSRLAAECDAGAAQTCSFIEWAIQDSAGTRIAILAYQYFGTQRASLNVDLTGLVLSPGLRLICRGTFNAGAVANELMTGVHGIVLPRGNWQFA